MDVSVFADPSALPDSGVRADRRVLADADVRPDVGVLADASLFRDSGVLVHRYAPIEGNVLVDSGVTVDVQPGSRRACLSIRAPSSTRTSRSRETCLPTVTSAAISALSWIRACLPIRACFERIVILAFDADRYEW
jgi:hypothetical protein